MQEISLNILDIAQNSIKAGATLIYINISQNRGNRMSAAVIDNGSGMTPEQVQNVINPFYTTRTTRKVGLGIPFFKMTAEMTGGTFEITSEIGKGTNVKACYCTDHIDMLPLGDITSTITALISVNESIDFIYTSKYNENEFTMDTREFKNVLGDVPINTPDILIFIKDYINENQQKIQ